MEGDEVLAQMFAAARPARKAKVKAKQEQEQVDEVGSMEDTGDDDVGGLFDEAQDSADDGG
eukprot:4797577-Heterocapsa_arctica.AAC.1